MALIAETLQGDLDKIRKEKAEIEARVQEMGARLATLQTQERGLQAALDYYTATSNTRPIQSTVASTADFASMTIAKAAALIFRDRQNHWLTTRELVAAFAERGKITSYNAMDITLKDASKTFEKKKERGKNYFRLTEPEW